MPSRTSTSTISKSKPHGQVLLQGANILPPSPSTSPDSYLLEKYRNQTSPPAKRFPLKNLRRKIPQPNLHDAASIPSIRQHGRDGADDRESLSLADLQAKIAILTKNLNSAEAALRKVGDEREEWKERCKTLEQRARTITKENRDLRVRNAELEAEIAQKKTIVEEPKDSEEEKQKKKRNRTSASYSEELKATRALISHHWNMQAEQATKAGKGTEWCDCVPSKTLRAVLKEGSNKRSPLLQANGFEDVAKGSPSELVDSEDEIIDDQRGHSQSRRPQANPEVREDARRQRKDALKKRIKEVRGYVEGLKRENDILEGILVSDNQGAPNEDAPRPRRNDHTTKRKH
ncbi:hypothetical protein TWF569_004387 [Orbilia oligospora]|nr:hypothetical protein TWF102_007376 [Orbilia oligospora]KAF3150848.1 hypothetical protein TWF569_004387 [Orbilia oligospora]KAF3167773.1 hypothetical protein TWF225_011923 [Orbilia oligospora]KAF3261900.1 hypothetical protein TWF217_004458 [Orbilia oligospora]KAF3265953.1 hypothetical protein TWF128_011527 [Orbilia oligospora]